MQKNHWMLFFYRKKWLLDLLVLVLLLLPVYFAAGVRTAVCVAVTGLVYTLGHFISYIYQKKKLQRMCSDIDRVLHGDYSLPMTEYAEGELSILQTEIHKMTIRLNEQAQALKADKRYLSDALADISHQLKTPLTSMNLMVAFLADEELSEPRRRALTMELDSSLQHVEWLITTLLKMSRLDADAVKFQKERVSVLDVVQEGHREVAVAMDLKEQHFVCRIGENVSFEGDRAWTAEALENMIKNCMEHTPPDGTVTVEALENPLYTQITVMDDGDGIAKEDLPHVFERFYRGHGQEKNHNPNASGGVGIGLALAAMIIQRQNGTIHVQNRNTGGAEFTIKFYKNVI